MYKVEYSQDFCFKYFDSLNKDEKRKILEFIENRIAPFPHESGKRLLGSLKGLWSARKGVHRIIYDIQLGVLVVLVIKIGHRKDVYKK